VARSGSPGEAGHPIDGRVRTTIVTGIRRTLFTGHYPPAELPLDVIMFCAAAWYRQPGFSPRPRRAAP